MYVICNSNLEQPSTFTRQCFYVSTISHMVKSAQIPFPHMQYKHIHTHAHSTCSRPHTSALPLLCSSTYTHPLETQKSCNYPHTHTHKHIRCMLYIPKSQELGATPKIHLALWYLFKNPYLTFMIRQREASVIVLVQRYLPLAWFTHRPQDVI